MNGYIYNHACQCIRCRAQGLMGPAVLITLGIVFLLPIHHGVIVPAALLIVVGVVKILQTNAPVDGHVNPAVIPVTEVRHG